MADEASSGFTFEVIETSPGAFLVTGRDASGRSAVLRGEDPEALRVECLAWLEEQVAEEASGAATYQSGDRVKYVAAPVFDLIIETGEIGVVTRVDGGWVYATWPRSGEHGVPVDHVEPAPPALG